jgi:hypothetical protein
MNLHVRISSITTQRRDRVANTPASYLAGDPGFKSRPGDRLSWQVSCGLSQSLQASVSQTFDSRGPLHSPHPKVHAMNQEKHYIDAKS